MPCGRRRCRSPHHAPRAWSAMPLTPPRAPRLVRHAAHATTRPALGPPCDTLDHAPHPAFVGRCRPARPTLSERWQAEDVAEGGLDGVGPVVLAHGPGEEGERVAVAGARPTHAAADASHPEALVVDAEP